MQFKLIQENIILDKEKFREKLWETRGFQEKKGLNWVKWWEKRKCTMKECKSDANYERKEKGKHFMILSVQLKKNVLIYKS